MWTVCKIRMVASAERWNLQQNPMGIPEMRNRVNRDKECFLTSSTVNDTKSRLNELEDRLA